MCGRYTSTTPAADLAAYFDADLVADDLGARYNVAPTDEVLVVAAGEGRRRLGTARWGLVPWWAKDPKVGSRMINARAETILDKSAFARPFASRRCLVPADGFYEWERRDGRKQPWHIHRPDGGPIAFAGLWDSWRPTKGSDEGRLVSCTIITTEANAALEPLHDRMPVVLPPEAWDAWLDPGNDDVAALRELLVPAPDDALVREAVGPAVNKVANDGPELLAPAAS